jgi:cholesterol transport system auxiliary component
MRLALSLSVVALVASGCAGLSSTTAHRYFVLEPPAPRAPAPASKRPETLLVAPTTAAPFYDTQEIVYSRAAGERAYYQYSSWTEPPARTIDALLVERLQGAGTFRAVAPATSGIRGTLLLRTRLLEMVHEAAAPPGRVRVEIAAELVDPESRVSVAQRQFSATAPAASYDAAGAVRAFDVAVAAIVDDVVDWTVGVRPGEHTARPPGS